MWTTTIKEWIQFLSEGLFCTDNQVSEHIVILSEKKNLFLSEFRGNECWGY